MLNRFFLQNNKIVINSDDVFFYCNFLTEERGSLFTFYLIRKKRNAVGKYGGGRQKIQILTGFLGYTNAT